MGFLVKCKKGICRRWDIFVRGKDYIDNEKLAVLLKKSDDLYAKCPENEKQKKSEWRVLMRDTFKEKGILAFSKLYMQSLKGYIEKRF